jgi:anti-sigma factor RsiW
MRRSRLESLLHDYAAGDLDAERRREVERRIAAEPRTRALYDQVRSAHDALKLLRERPEPPVQARDVVPRIQAAIALQAFEAKPSLPLEGMGTRYYRRIAIAATLLFAATVGYVTLAPRPDPPSAPTETLTSPPAAERVIELGGRREGITAEEFFRLLDETGEMPSVTPVVNVVPPR